VITRMILVKVPPDKSAEAERLWREDCGALLIEQRAARASSYCVAGKTQASLYRLAAGTAKKRSIAIAAATPIGRSNNMPAR